MVRATCHPDRTHLAKGLCKPCYNHKATREARKQVLIPTGPNIDAGSPLARVRELFHAGLRIKTGWGRNEVLTLLDRCITMAVSPPPTPVELTTEHVVVYMNPPWEEDRS